MKRLPVLVLLAVSVVAGCAGNQETSTTVEAPTTTNVAPISSTPGTTAVAGTANSQPETTTTTSGSTTTTSTSTTSPTLCPQPVELAEGTLIFAGGSGDLDGDGLSDELFTYQAGENDWRVRVTFADGGGADAGIAQSDDLTPPRPIGGFDVDGDGAEEAFLTVGAGASTTLVGLFDISACVVQRITTGGVAAVFSVGASLGAESGLICPGDGTLRRNFAQRVDQDSFEGGYEEFSVDGTNLIPIETVSGLLTSAEAAQLATLDCGGLTLP